MSATVIDGKAFAAKVRDKVAAHVARIKADAGITPGLAVVLVGEDPASQVYVRSKGKMTVAVGMASFEHKRDVDISEADLLALIADLNADPAVHGILVQLPLPPHLDSDLVINSIDPAKDVDGFHISAGRQLHRDHRAQPDQGFAGRGAPSRHRRRRCGPCRNGAGRLDQTGGHGD